MADGQIGPQHRAPSQIPRSDRTSDEREASAVFSVLAHPLRREILHLLREAPDHRLSIDSIAERIGGQSERRGGGCDEAAVAMATHHVHVPKLTELDCLEVDGETLAFHRCTDSAHVDLLEYHLSYPDGPA